MKPNVTRRAFLALGAAGAAGLAAAGCGSSSVAPATTSTEMTSTTTSTTPRSRRPTGQLPRADWLDEENQRPGSLAWALGAGPPTSGDLEGFCSTTSATYGDEVTFYVRASRRFRIEAYRMGYYQGFGARLIASSHVLPAQAQSSPRVTASLGTVECEWTPSWTIVLDPHTYPPGCYLFRLVTDEGWKQWIPLTVRDDASTAAFVFMNSVTTWQAYNPWGGWSLYDGPTGRADVVSFDRPYALGLGQSNFLFNELPVLYDMERLGLDLSYWTDMDLHLRGEALTRHRCLMSLGHDEYWSYQMRELAIAALHQGVNLAFLGSNFCYRAVRFEPSNIGPDRRMVNYRSTADPIYASDPKLTTVNWQSPPLNMPESDFSGSRYAGFESPGTSWDLVVVDPTSWFWRDTGVEAGTHLLGIEQNEFNHFDDSSPVARHVEILAHSPVPGTGQWSDATYVALPGQGGVFCSGTSTWALAMSNGVRIPHSVMHRRAGSTPVVLGAMRNLYRVFGDAPAGVTHPSQSNSATLYG